MLSELIVHVLQIGDLDAWRRSSRAIRLLTADDINREGVVLVGSGFGAHENVAGAESARLIIRGYIKGRSNDENAKVGVESCGYVVSARRRRLRIGRRSGTGRRRLLPQRLAERRADAALPGKSIPSLQESA